MEQAFSNLRIDASDYAAEQGPPVYRSGADEAFASWALNGGGGAIIDQVTSKDPFAAEPIKMRCVPMDGWIDGLVGEQLPKLLVSVTPHRVDGEESLVCSLRQFNVKVVLVDVNGAPIPRFDAHLTPSLVYADTGEPVPSQKGEAPLAGEITGKQMAAGECLLRLRVSALSYHHNRRAFAIRVDADGLHPGGVAGGFGISLPLKSVARLPDAAKFKSTSSVAPAAAAIMPSTSASTSTTVTPSLPSPVRPPCIPTVVTFDDGCAARCLPLTTLDTARSPLPFVLRLRRSEDDECMLELDDLESECCPLPMPTSGPHPTPVTIPSDPQSGHHTYTSHMVIADELKVHADMLRRVSAQQQFILDELARIESSKQPLPFRSATSVM